MKMIEGQVLPPAKRKAGRPLGSATRVTREMADRLSSDGGLVPLEAMVGNMRYFANEAVGLAQLVKQFADELRKEKLTKKQKTALQRALDLKKLFSMLAAVEGATMRAQECARDAAPYMHPRLGHLSVDSKGPTSIHFHIEQGLENL